MNRIVRADVNLPENMTHEYPEASRCTRAMLRQQPDRRPSATSLLNRPRLQPPSYDLPGMQLEPVKAFDPPGRESARPQQIAEEVAAAAAAANNAVKAAAFSPRTKVRAKVNQILDSELEVAPKVIEDERAHRKGIVDHRPDRVRRQASGTSTGTPSAYPGPSSSARQASRTDRAASRDAQPLSARPKAPAASAPFFLREWAFLSFVARRTIIKRGHSHFRGKCGLVGSRGLPCVDTNVGLALPAKCRSMDVIPDQLLS